MDLADIEKGTGWVLLYILLVTLLWPLCVLLISIPFGQLSFFQRYLQKMFRRLTGKKERPVSIALFASGAGSNAEKIIHRFNSSSLKDVQGSHSKQNRKAFVSLVVCNKPGAGVTAIAAREGIETLLIEKEQFFNGDHYLPALRSREIDLIILAGFLWKLPPELTRAYQNKIVNIHPALLPRFGGKGMYGKKVHEAVLAAGEKESGITIHYVDEFYDHGKVILQVRCPVEENDTADSLAQKIHILEHQHYPAVIEKLVNAK